MSFLTSLSSKSLCLPNASITACYVLLMTSVAVFPIGLQLLAKDMQ